MKMNVIEKYIDRFCTRYLGGHWNIGPITIYGYNAMHWAVNIRVGRGWLCLKPISWVSGHWWPGYLYYSKNATPDAAKWGLGYGRSWFKPWHGSHSAAT